MILTTLADCQQLYSRIRVKDRKILVVLFPTVYSQIRTHVYSITCQQTQEIAMRWQFRHILGKVAHFALHLAGETALGV